MEGKGKLRKGIDYGMHSNQEGNVSKTLKTEESFVLNKNMLLNNFVCFVFFLSSFCMLNCLIFFLMIQYLCFIILKDNLTLFIKDFFCIPSIM